MNSTDSLLWSFGVAEADITPHEPVILAGYLREESTSTIRNPLSAKAVYLQAGDGSQTLIINAEVIGFSDEFTRRLGAEVERRHGIPAAAVILNASHNHSGPVIEGVLPLFNDLTEEEAEIVKRYTATLFETLVRCAAEARGGAMPCTIDYYCGVAGFGVNRRRVSWHLRDLPDVVDHDVPVLVARDEGGAVRGILFGYACHTTVMYDNAIDGDYSGYAQRALESAFPGAKAVFLAGCGGDINPHPRRKLELSESYGQILSFAVQDAMESEKTRLPGHTLKAQWCEVELPMESFPAMETLERQLDECTLRERVIRDQFRPMPMGMSPAELEEQIALSMQAVRRKVAYQIRQRSGGNARASVPYRIQTLTLGEAISLVALEGEPVVDYALMLKARHGVLQCWPIGYCGHLVAYIPSRRVLREGGYEGKSAMLEYGLPSVFTDDLEAVIMDAVDSQLRETSCVPVGPRGDQSVPA